MEQAMLHDFVPTAIIDRAALRHNLAQVRIVAPNSKIWAVVKADAYGHGAFEISKAITPDGLAVARFSEAQSLRAAGEQRPILIMGGVYTESDLQAAIDLDCEIAVHNIAQAHILKNFHTDKTIRIWLKVNTGMNRLGFAHFEAAPWLQELSHYPAIRGHPGLMTHLANADDLFDPTTTQQCQRIQAIPGANKCRLSIGNSAGLLGWEAARTDWVRPGLMLYGLSPFQDEIGAQRNLIPVMNLCAPLISVYQCKAGAAIGYSGTYVCPETMPVGVIGIGYGDGYPRHAQTGTPILLAGQRVPLIGRVSMDMISVDLRGVPKIPPIGTEALLWGQELPTEEIASCANTIVYQLVTGITNRVQRIYIN